MARQTTVTVGDEDYNITTASAKNQFEALHITMRTSMISSVRDEPSEMGAVAAFGFLSFEDINRLVNLLVKDNVTRSSDGVPVAENLFGDRIQEYYLLVYHVIRENLAGFWKLRRPADRSQAAEPDSSTTT